MENNKDLNSFYNEINALYSNLMFTLERSANGKLLFLDTEVKLTLNRPLTNVYRKPTDSDLLM